LILCLLTAGLIGGGVDLLVLDGAAAGRAPHWVALVAGGSLTALALQLGLFRREFAPWAATGALAVVSMSVAILDFYPGIATTRSKVTPVIGLCHAEIDRAAPIICYGLSHEADSLAFHLGRYPVQNYESVEVNEAAGALRQAPEMLVLANANEIQYLRERLPDGLTLAELGRHEHIFVGLCTAAPRIAARK
jgi:hypothetical protein